MSRHRLAEPPSAHVLRGLTFCLRWLRGRVHALTVWVEADPQTARNLVNGTLTLLVMAYLALLVLVLAPVSGLGWAFLIVGAGCGALYAGLVWLGERR